MKLAKINFKRHISAFKLIYSFSKQIIEMDLKKHSKVTSTAGVIIIKNSVNVNILTAFSKS